MKRAILVTGAHRSGSTWTGKVISQSKNVRYVQEPFNLSIKKYNSPIKSWFEHLNISKDTNYQDDIKVYLESFLKPSIFNKYKHFGTLKGPKLFYSYFLDFYRKTFKRTLIKDPIAIMSAEWIYKTFPTDVVILIRHPAAFIASLKVKGWEFNFNAFLDQPDLMHTYLESYRDEMTSFTNKKQPILLQGILLWNILYSVVLCYQETYKNTWYFVKHEDLSEKPIEKFSELFNFLNLPFDNSVKNYIRETTTSTNSSDLKRDSKSNILKWKERLSTEEIEQIKLGTYEVWKHFYEEKDW